MNIPTGTAVPEVMQTKKYHMVPNIKAFDINISLKEEAINVFIMLACESNIIVANLSNVPSLHKNYLVFGGSISISVEVIVSNLSG